MISAQGSRATPAWLTAAGLAAVLMGLSAGQKRLSLPFEPYPGAVYLALMSVPILSRGGGSPGAASDIQIGAYLGPAYTQPSSLRLVQPGGNDVTFDGVHWDGKPFKVPPYYGYRAMYWPGSGKTGLMADFTHIKAISVKDRPVRQTGLRDGFEVPPEQPLSATFKRLEFTHGYNLLTANLLRRGEPRGPYIVPYGGIGLGVAIPHVEVQRLYRLADTRTFEYQIAGPALQLIGGVEWRVGRRLSLFVEYKLSCAAITGDLVGGGTVSTNLCTHQLPLGVSVHLRPRAAAMP